MSRRERDRRPRRTSQSSPRGFQRQDASETPDPYYGDSRDDGHRAEDSDADDFGPAEY